MKVETIGPNWDITPNSYKTEKLSKMAQEAFSKKGMTVLRFMVNDVPLFSNRYRIMVEYQNQKYIVEAMIDPDTYLGYQTQMELHAENAFAELTQKDPHELI